MATSETKHDRALRRKRNLSSGPAEVDLSPIEAGPRIAIEGVCPEIDGGRFAVKRSVGDIFSVEADIFSDGHDKLNSVILFRLDTERNWHEAPMHQLENDRWRGSFPLLENGRYVT
jgi:starch synthase (maltosyl-transferring)